MSVFFALLYVVAFVVFIVFLIKSIISKKKGMDNKTCRIVWIVALFVFFFSFIITAILNPTPKSNEDKVPVENSTEESSGVHVEDDKAESVTSETELNNNSDSIGENTAQNESIEGEANTVATEEVIVSEEPIEMNALQSLFASINSDMSRDEIDAYIEENGLVKYAFTHDSAYYIGYDNSAIRQRGRDREGEAVDIDFVTSGDPNKLGKVKSAQFTNHTGFNSRYPLLRFEDNKFYFDGSPCSNGEEAMQKYLHDQAQ